MAEKKQFDGVNFHFNGRGFVISRVLAQQLAAP
jgi:hypothetical protein